MNGSEAIELTEPVQKIMDKYNINPCEHMNVLQSAFTHVSLDHINNYEVLELIGDGVISLAVRTWLAMKYPDADPGKLSVMAQSIENRPSLAFQGLALGLDQIIRYNEKNPIKINDRILCDLVEALVGTIFTITGQDWERTYQATLDIICIEQKVGPERDYLHPINQLQEMTQAKQAGLPQYHFRTVMNGNDRLFSCKIIIKDIYKGPFISDTSKAKAKNAAAIHAIQELQKETITWNS